MQNEEKKPLILIVDDTPTNIQVLAEALRADYRIRGASSGQTAFEIIAKLGLPDLILLDVVIPEMDGYEICRRLKQSPETKNVPVIFVTAKNEAVDEEHGFKLGAVDYITKPITPAVMLVRVRTQIEANRARDWLKNENTLLETEVKRRTAEVLEAKTKLQATLDAIPDLLFELGLDGHYYDYHSPHIELLAAPAEKLIGNTISNILPPDAADVNMSALREAHEKGYSSGKQFELRLPQGNLWFELSVSRKPTTPDQEPRFIALSRDITERKRMEQLLRDFSTHILDAREDEKTTIAREIHDDLGGTLLNLKLETNWLKTELSANGKATTRLLEHIESMSQEIEHAACVMRSLITGLRPPILDEIGLLAALEWQAVQFHKHSGIKCRVNCVGDKGNLDKRCSSALFRISQEALSNVAKHSGASSVEIEFLHSDEEVFLSIIDNGHGMTEKITNSLGHYGISGMIERVKLLGGKISFTSPSPTHTGKGGLNVTVILPLSAKSERAT